jgi:putative tryptophan/tyrosine transport system substrate-binding protein
MRRRAFISLLGGAAAAWSRTSHAQPGDRMRRIGALMLYTENDPVGQGRSVAFRQELEKLGWIVGGNLTIDFHWGVGDGDWIREAAAHLLAQSPDLILANGSAAVRPIQEATRTVPIIFIGGGGDPVAEGFAQTLAHPGGNLTGFTVLEPSLGAKLLALLKEIAPRVDRVAVLINPDSLSSQRLAASAAAAAQKFAVEVAIMSGREPAGIEAALATRVGDRSDGLIVPPDPVTNTHRKLIVELAARHRLPAIYGLRRATAEGGLMSYGVDIPNLFRKAAVYADRILKGEKPADLPVQQPTKFELVINLKTAKALGLDVSSTLLVAAGEVIE